jgi:hypothetical protein
VKDEEDYQVTQRQYVRATTSIETASILKFSEHDEDF